MREPTEAERALALRRDEWHKKSNSERLQERVDAFFIELQRVTADVDCSCCMQTARIIKRHCVLLAAEMWAQMERERLDDEEVSGGD